MYRCRCRLWRSNGLNLERERTVVGKLMVMASLRYFSLHREEVPEKFNAYLLNMEWRGLFFLFGVWFRRNLLSFPAQWIALDISAFQSRGPNESKPRFINTHFKRSINSDTLDRYQRWNQTNICSLEDSMDFLCSEEVIELGTLYSVINMCSGMVFFFFLIRLIASLSLYFYLCVHSILTG